MLEDDPANVCTVGVAGEVPVQREVHAVVGLGRVSIAEAVGRRSIAKADPAKIRCIAIACQESIRHSHPIGGVRGRDVQVDPPGIRGVGIAVRGADGREVRDGDGDVGELQMRVGYVIVGNGGLAIAAESQRGEGADIPRAIDHRGPPSAAAQNGYF